MSSLRVMTTLIFSFLYPLRKIDRGVNCDILISEKENLFLKGNLDEKHSNILSC